MLKIKFPEIDKRTKLIINIKEGRIVSTRIRKGELEISLNCNKSHRFKKTTIQIRENEWCTVCASVTVNNVHKKPNYQEVKGKEGRKELRMLVEKRIEKMHGTLAPTRKKKGIIFNRKFPIRINCVKGHLFRMKPFFLIEGEWCPECHTQEIKEYIINNDIPLNSGNVYYCSKVKPVIDYYFKRRDKINSRLFYFEPKERDLIKNINEKEEDILQQIEHVLRSFAKIHGVCPRAICLFLSLIAFFEEREYEFLYEFCGLEKISKESIMIFKNKLN